MFILYLAIEGFFARDKVLLQTYTLIDDITIREFLQFDRILHLCPTKKKVLLFVRETATCKIITECS